MFVTKYFSFESLGKPGRTKTDELLELKGGGGGGGGGGICNLSLILRLCKR